MHFWLYSLLAAPFIWGTDALGVRPLLALTVVNACAASGLVAYLLRFFRSTALELVAPLLYLSCGTVFYLHWTGPEVLTAAAVLVAALSGLRGQLGVSIIAASIAAAQNPSAAGVLLWTFGCRLGLELGWCPGLLERESRHALKWHEFVLAGCGIALLLLPYGFFQVTFGSASLIARDATRPELIGFERAWSLLFDLNQGLFIGMPGLLLALFALAALTLDGHLHGRRRNGLLGLLACAAFFLMLVPTLSIDNLNSGGLVVHRYCTWLAMPLLGLVLALLSNLRIAWFRPVAGLFFAGQLIVIALAGISADPMGYLRHGKLASYVLERWPSFYNPVPEIFLERTLGQETVLRADRAVKWPKRGGQPTKVMIHESRVSELKTHCGDEQRATAATEASVEGGWRYLDAPFRCSDQ
jgi:hypothetical protein